MRPLSEVFAPGAPTLPERLRTLVVSPDRELEPGMTVRATFTFRNQGGAPATGVRLRFNVPEGLVYLIGSGKLDGNDLDDDVGNTPLLSRAGAQIGDVPPGQERRIEIAYSVAGAIENGTVVELQAALASFELAPIGSNVVRLFVHSKPQLRNALTQVAIDTHHIPAPGSEAQVTIRIHNAGQSSAHDIVVVAPVPEHATYLPGSVRVNGREFERELNAPFDRVHAPIVLRTLPANASATLVFRIRIGTPLPNGTQIVAYAQVASQETPAFSLEPASLTTASAPDFGDDRTSFTADPAHDVHPGERVNLVLVACNSGTADAQRVSATVELPENLLLVRGSSSIDGRATRERRKDPLRFAIGRVNAGESVTVRIDAVVASPIADGTQLTSAATLEWEPLGEAQRRLECVATVRSEPAFAARRNFIERLGTAVVRPGHGLEAAIVIANDGGAAAHDAVLHLRIATPLDELVIFEGDTQLSLDGDTVDLEALAPHEARRLTFRARTPSPIADHSELRIAASLHTRELGETPLREVFWRVDSHPAFREESSRLDLSEESELRPNQLAQVDVCVNNVGTDTAHNVSLRLFISPEARLETVDGATREKSTLHFGELGPGARARARLGLRLLRSLAREYPVTIDAVLTADAVLPVPLTRLTIATIAEPDFSVANFRSEPADSVDAGEPVDWVLQIRNGGDGVAHRAFVTVTPPESLIYVPNSTTVNDVPVRDVGASPPFAADDGIALNEVDPGVEATIRWRTVVHNGLPDGTAIAHLARVRYDGDREDELSSTQLTVRSAPVFANSIPGLPFGLDGMVGPALGSEQRAIAQDRILELPPATPVADGNGAPYFAQLVAGSPEPAEAITEIGDRAGTLVSLNAERLARTLRFLREARFGGLVTHLFAVRAFLPDAIGDAHAGALEGLRDCLREELDRLFIKLRLPRFAIAARDVETPSLRVTIERTLHEAASARGVPAQPPTPALELRGMFRHDEIGEIGERLASYELASALPWAALARFLPDDTPLHADYRNRLIETFDGFDSPEAGEFIEALQQHSDPAIDAALDAMCVSLHVTA